MKNRKNSNPQSPPMRPFIDEPEEESSRYDADRELESSLPYGIQNVLEGESIRLPRSRGHNRVTFQSLCPSRREMVMLNADTEYEYRPDHYEEVTCARSTAHEFKLNNNELTLPVSETNPKPNKKKLFFSILFVRFVLKLDFHVFS